MTDFIAMIYEWLGYATDLGDHLRGMDVTCSGYIGTNIYLQVFVYMILINLVFFVLMYFVIDRMTVRFSTKSSWWITASAAAVINFFIAFSIPNSIDVCSEILFSGSDLFLFGAANAIWSVTCFVLLSSFPFPRNYSKNCRLTTFWKP